MAANSPKYTDRTIYDFRSRLTGGGARSNLFECEMKFPSLLEQDNELQLDIRMLIKAAQLPGSNLNTIPVAFRGRTLKIAGDRTFEPWSITVLNDTTFRLRNAFEKWSNLINRHEDNSGLVTPGSYQTDIIVHQLSRGTPTGNDTGVTKPDTNSTIPIIKSYKLYGCYPSSIDPIPLSYDSSDSIEEFNVTFEVQWWDALDDNFISIFQVNDQPNTVINTTPAPNL